MRQHAEFEYLYRLIDAELILLALIAVLVFVFLVVCASTRNGSKRR